MPTSAGIRAFVTSPTTESPLQEHSVRQDGQRSICYIEAVEGQEFQVVFERQGQEGTALDGKLTIDGQKTRGVTVRVNRVRGAWKGQRISETQERPYRFGKLRTTDDDDFTMDESTLKGLGEIRVQIYRSAVIHSSEWLPQATPYSSVDKVHERSKKAQLSHLAELGDAKRTGPAPGLVTTTLLEHNPVAEFIFRYRSRALLEAEGIVQPIINAAPVAAPPPPSQPKRQAPQSSTTAKRPKAEPIDIDDMTPPDVKPAAFPFVAFKVEDNGCIDLT